MIWLILMLFLFRLVHNHHRYNLVHDLFPNPNLPNPNLPNHSNHTNHSADYLAPHPISQITLIIEITVLTIAPAPSPQALSPLAPLLPGLTAAIVPAGLRRD